MGVKRYKDRIVRLRETVTTAGGDVWPKGEVVRCCSVWRGKVSLERIKTKEDGCVSVVRHVEPWKVELLPKDPVRLISMALDGVIEIAADLGFVIRISPTVELNEGEYVVDPIAESEPE